MYIRFQNRDIRVISSKVSWQLNAATDFDISIPLQDLPDLRRARMRPIELYHRGALFLDGFITDSPAVEINSDSVLVAKLNGFGELGWLTRWRAKADSHYQNTAVLDIIEDLLLATNGEWELGDISTMVDPLIETTIDLREKEELFAQIVETAKATPDVHLRYGGKVNGVHRLDVGNFNQVTERLVQGSNLKDPLKRKRVTAPFYSVVEAYGNWAGTSEVLNLSHALSDSRTAAHPDYVRYPILADGSTWVVADQEEIEGGEVTRFFNLAKTKNKGDPTAAEVSEAGYALWLKTVRFLKSHVEHDEYSGDVFLDHVPKVGDKTYIRSNVVEPIVDRVRREARYLPIFEIDDFYRITSVDFSFQSGVQNEDPLRKDLEHPTDLFSIEVTSNDEAENIDPELELYEKLEGGSQFDTPGFSVPPPVSVTHDAADPADCVFGGGGGPANAKTFTLVSPPKPSWANRVSVNWAADPADSLIYVVQAPAPTNPGGNLILCVQDGTGVWPPLADDDLIRPITVTAQFVFTKV